MDGQLGRMNRIAHENAAIVIGIIAALVINLPVALVTHESSLAVVGAVLVVLTSLVIDINIRMRTNQKELQEIWQLEKVLSKLRDVGDIMRDVISNTGVIMSRKNQYFCDYMNIALKQTAVEIKRLAGGHLLVQGQDYFDILIGFTNKAKSKIIATSLVATSDWWKGPLGIQYRSANFEALKRNVSIIRVFIYKTEDAVTKDDIEEMLSQNNEGVVVRVAYADQLKDERLIQDMAILDDDVGIKLELVPRTYSVSGCHFYDKEYSGFVELKLHMQHLCLPSNSVGFDDEKQRRGW